MGNSTAPNSVPLMTTAEQNKLNRSRRPPLYDSPEEMALPIKKRKLCLTENAVCNEKELENSFCKFGDDQKVLEVGGARLQDVGVAFNNASDGTLREKKDVKIEEVWSHHQQGAGGNMKTCGSYIEKFKEDKDKTPCASHPEYFKDRPKLSNNHSLLKMKNLRGLIPSCKFHYVRRRSSFSCKIEDKNTDASLYLPKEHDSEPKIDVAANRRAYLAIPISMEATQIGIIPLVSQNLERTTTRSEPSHVSRVERKHSDDGTHNIDFKGSTGTIQDLEVGKKIIRTYVRNKYRKPLFKGLTGTIRALEVSQIITKT
ncbi:uncharacterized protein LOC110026803 isoform X2 [Phalaenopsis equestris]|uniref:uncharacterized protein LOC110026803 isoform X2 n=1 Tax=Phalaenopsis equestris TaxID=78828 RepID=UPI0009E41904|nr:uncharacterized protein LOC110026803 isoform X2 [Phalaenopsis equestris]